MLMDVAEELDTPYRNRELLDVGGSVTIMSFCGMSCFPAFVKLRLTARKMHPQIIFLF
jgi:hypothetical protein